MKVRFLGTAAFEGIPSLFCSCELCRKAMELGGKNIRTRTSVLLDDDLKVDFPPDTMYHMLRDRLDLDRVKDILLTHSHTDHLYAPDLAARLPGYAQAGESPIHLYGNDLAIAECLRALNAEGGVRGKYAIHRAQPFRRIELQTGIAVPLPASHDPNETCLLYYIEKSGKTVLYGHDGGWFPEETWNWLRDKKLDLAILECTMGRIDHRTNHMNVDAVLETVDKFAEYGMMKPGGAVAVTHFSHNAHLLHEELIGIFEPHGIRVAYDGMVLDM
ncbi:MBL fold metallo-hydrolase [Cohnella zeiphila]|uniref:Carbon-phosphorus lyase n=1 Tax=Cohnella zeiphila TaxID=2761120 RepID=A0A7X0SJK4_9BACL|nr:MBL fold metallo-hydrolase [Cohnella zeiphila]MBB6729870.1 carbon-phosphorus lyase [Cohnella zeiphila]